MLLRFSVENFMSFRDRAEFSMVPSKVATPKGHVVPALSRNDIAALKTSVIYGANASGKSNLIKAMSHAQTLITKGKRASQSLPHDPFLLDKHTKDKPSRFEFEIKCNETNYAYGFIVDRKKVYEEWLFEITRVKDVAIYERVEDEFDLSGLEGRVNSEEDKNFLSFTAMGTPENRLFLLECFERNVFKQLSYLTCIQEVFGWFSNRLKIIFPNSKYHGLEMDFYNGKETTEHLARLLNAFDTGVSTLKLHKLDFNTDVELPDALKTSIADSLEEQESAFVASTKSRFQIIRDENGEISAHKLMACHTGTGGEEVLFDLVQESDGTQRLLDLAPGLIDLLRKDYVYVVDELDRSLHPDISTNLVSNFLEKTRDKHSQLIVTTHETCLLRLDLLRRDEIWFVSKTVDGVSKVYSLEEYKTRPDKDVRKDYLNGRFGAVPAIKQLFLSDDEEQSNA